MAAKLFVGGLSWNTTEDSLRQAFSQLGTVVSATVITDKFTGKSKGFGFVEMGSPEEAQHAIQEMNGKDLDGRTIVVNEARPMVPRENRGGDFHHAGGGDFHRGGGGHGFHEGRDNRGGGDDRGGRNW
jgi:cold-inducible RNA-binding protein